MTDGPSSMSSASRAEITGSKPPRVSGLLDGKRGCGLFRLELLGEPLPWRLTGLRPSSNSS